MNLFTLPSLQNSYFSFRRAKKYNSKFKPGGQKYQRGMTLLEVLVSISIFAFMFLFIAQVTKQSHRQVKKIKKDTRSSYSLSHVLDIMRQDFRGVAYLLDLNYNFYAQFPIEMEKDQSLGFEEEKSLGRANQEAQKAYLPIFFSTQYVFQGTEREVEFSSYSFLKSSDLESLAQWIKIRYSVESCPQSGEGSKADCLFRSVKKFWNNEVKEDEEEEKLILLRGFQSLSFFYASSVDFLEGEWKKEWEPEKISDRGGSYSNQIVQVPFPSVVKIEWEKENRRQSVFFPISSFHLKAWNPIEKDFPGFPKWESPKKTGKTSPAGPSNPVGPPNPAGPPNPVGPPNPASALNPAGPPNRSIK